jgi:hypothetical protein
MPPASASPSHPAPARDKAPVTALFFGLMAAPLAWSLQSIGGYAISSEACYPGDTPRLTPMFNGLTSLLLGINFAALLIEALALIIAYRSWAATRHEQGGTPQHLIERGEGRTRFLAMWGILVSGAFIIATLFSTTALMLSPVCR